MFLKHQQDIGGNWDHKRQQYLSSLVKVNVDWEKDCEQNTWIFVDNIMVAKLGYFSFGVSS